MIRPKLKLRKAQSEPGRRTAKKLVVSLKKKKSKISATFEEDTWAKLKEAVAAVHAQTSVAYSREELYNAVENMCLQKKSESLYERLKVLCVAHIRTLVENLTGQSLEVVAFLHTVRDTWQQHCDQMVIIRSIFLVLDRNYVAQSADVRSLWDLGLELFRANLLEQEGVLSKLVEGMLDLITKERRGETISQPLLLSLSRMFSQLKIYQKHFEAPFLKTTAEFYREEGGRQLDAVGVAKYMIHVEQRLAEENQRLGAYLDFTTRQPLVAAVEQELIEAHSQAIIDKGFSDLMDEMRKVDLGRMYQLLLRVSAIPALNEQFAAYAKAKGVEIVNDVNNDKTMVESLLKLRASLVESLSEAFHNNDSFKRSLKSAFEFFINVRHNKPAEMIAKFVDRKLRSKKGASETEVEETLDRVMELFRSINGKDVFEAFYKKDLAKRLLLNRSASAELERSMLSKLKTECGSQFTSKLEGMFKDVKLSKGTMAEYLESDPFKAAELPFDCGVHILTTTYWPVYTVGPLTLPPAIARAQASFQEFYLAKFNGRRLQWVNNLGQCVLRARFKSGKKELDVSLHQACVLLQFNQGDDEFCLTFEQLQERVGLEPAALKLTLTSLACMKVRVLSKTPAGKSVNATDSFTVNNKFRAKLFRIKINSIQLKETKKEQKDTQQRVFKQRLYQIDAGIVRIMKTRKTLSHAVLMSELYAQLRFPVEPSQVKKRIESLLEREYLERSEDARNVYNYVA